MGNTYTPEEAAFDQGKMCFENGGLQDTCPYDRFDDVTRSRREAWLTGYSAAWCNARPRPDMSKPKTTTVVWHTDWNDLPDKDETVIVEIWDSDRRGTSTYIGEITNHDTWMIMNRDRSPHDIRGWCRFPRMGKEGVRP